jgi:hypothetical protein
VWDKRPLALPADEASFHVWRLQALRRVMLFRHLIFMGAGLLLGCIPVIALGACGALQLRWFNIIWLGVSSLIMMTGYTLYTWQCWHNERVIEALKAEGRLRVITHEEEL